MATEETKDTTTASTADDDPREDWQIQRDDLKAKGDAAFRMKGFRTAISEYTAAISLDPDFVVLYSNRSAAYLANSESSKALRDAQKCVELDPEFAKGYSRLAAALFALRRYDKAKEAYEKVLEKDADNKAATNGIVACDKELEKIRIKQQEDAQWEAETKKNEAKPAEATQDNTPAAAADDGDADDDLADFFDEVEDVVIKQKEKVAAVVNAQPEATNAIKNDRTALGTTQDQISRLLQSHYEWRNLNPFYVLELPHTATDDDISRRYKALSLLLHPDKNHAKLRDEEEKEKCQLAYDQVQKAKQTLSDEDKKRHVVALVEEGMKAGEHKYAKQQAYEQAQAAKKWVNKNQENEDAILKDLQEKEVMRIFAQVERKRRDMEERERSYEQRQQQQQDEQDAKERKERQFDKSWRQEERVDKRVGNWRDFSGGSSTKKQKK